MRLRAAVIGLGRMGSTIDDERGPWSSSAFPYAHTPCYRNASVEVAAGSDPHEGQRAAYQQKWGVERVYANYREMLERERPDIVSVCTSARPRACIVQDVVELGAGRGLKAIWAEKPISISLEEADQMVDTCRRAGVLLAIGCSRNWHPGYNRMREVIEAGEIGQVLQVIGLGQAGLSHNGSHLLATTNYLAGSTVRWVFGHMASDEKAAGDEDLEGNGYLHYASSAQAYVRAMPVGGASWEFEVIGSQGRVRAVSDAQQIEFWKNIEPTLEGRRREPARHIFPLPWFGESPNARTVRDLLVCIETGKQPNCSGEDGRHALEVAIAMRESHRRGGTRVDLPLVDRALRILSQETLAGDEPQAVRRARATQTR
jgi:predicted dehydrogenase